MNENILISKIEMDCPICNQTHKIEFRERVTQALLKDEVVEYKEKYYVCDLSDEEENEFTPAKIMDENLLRVRDAYRVKKNLLTSSQIASIRKYYNLTQSEYSNLLGWGDITVTRYESKSIQDETYDNIMKISKENPLFTLECLEKHKEKFSDEKYSTIKNNIIKRVQEISSAYLVKEQILAQYVAYGELSEYNGMKLLDIEKVSNVIGYFSNLIPELYKVKLMKLLWYADAVFFRRYNKAMTGLVYTHMTYGALPIGYNEIIRLPSVKVIEKNSMEFSQYQIVPNKEISLSSFNAEELSVLSLVVDTFKSYNTEAIVNYMHKEKAYKETEPREVISYLLSKELNDLT